MGEQGIPLIKKWTALGKLDFSNPVDIPATEGARRIPLLSGYILQNYWDLLEPEFRPKGKKLLSVIELWTRNRQGSKTLNEWLTYVYNICQWDRNLEISLSSRNNPEMSQHSSDLPMLVNFSICHGNACNLFAPVVLLGPSWTWLRYPVMWFNPWDWHRRLCANDSCRDRDTDRVMECPAGAACAVVTSGAVTSQVLPLNTISGMYSGQSIAIISRGHLPSHVVLPPDPLRGPY